MSEHSGHRGTVICLPFAGAGSSFFRAWEPAAAEHGLALHAVQLPGREERFTDSAYPDLKAAVEDLTWRARKASDDATGPVALFGHSLGAVLAYEVARQLPVARLVVSGSSAPEDPRERRATGLDDDEFVARIEELAGYRHPAFDNPEIRELLLPTLRADVELHEEYRPLPGPPAESPITAVRGRDDTLVTAEQAAGWADATSGGFELVEVGGGHMYLSESADQLLAMIASGLEGHR